ncbi:hypothetical protein D3C72_2349960 [compost metagenome]
MGVMGHSRNARHHCGIDKGTEEAMGIGCLEGGRIAEAGIPAFGRRPIEQRGDFN